MPGKRMTPEQITKAIAMREAGYTLAAITHRLDVSISTLQRLFKKYPVTKYKVTDEQVENVREELLDTLSNDASLRHDIAKMYADDIAQVNLIRQKALLQLEAMTASDPREAAIIMRALVAYSTLLKNTSDIIRNSPMLSNINVERESDKIPELVIRTLTDEEVAELNRVQAEQYNYKDE